MAELDIKAALIGSGHKFRKEILLMPVVALSDTTNHMTIRYGVRGKETVGEVRSGAKLRPYKTAKGETNTASLDGRTLETFMGDVVEEFDPYTLYGTVYSEPISKKRTELEVVKTLAVEMSRQATEDLPKAIFTGVRNASGEETMDLFDGFDTITKAEKLAGNISVEKGNFIELGGINAANVGDKLKAIYSAASQVLKNGKTKLFIPVHIKEMYDEWALAVFGPVAYNTQYEQTFLHGTNKKCELVDLPGMIDSTHMFLTTKKTMLVGVDQESDLERVEINKCDNPKVVQFFMTAYFGAQFESIHPKRLMAAHFSVIDTPNDLPVLESDQETIVCNDTEVDATSTKTVVISGTNLTSDVDLSVQGAGFTLSAYEITKAQAEAVGGKEITITFSPLAAQNYIGKIIATSGDVSVEINLTGTGIASPVLAASPASVACDNTVANATSTKTVVISGENLSGNVELAVQGAGFTLSAYTITKAEAEAAGGKEITVTFAPLAAQAYAGKIVAVGGGASLTINLTGTGTAE